MSRKAEKKPKGEFPRKAGVFILSSLFRLLLMPRISYESKQAEEYIKSSEPSLIISNHSNWFDPVMMYAITKTYRLSVVTAKEVLSGPKGKALGILGCIPVDRTTMDLVCLRECTKRIKQGEKVAIFPEGRINFDDDNLNPFKAGVSLIAAQTGARVVPVYISGDYRLFGKVRVLVGESVDLSEHFSATPTAAEISEATEYLFERELELKGKLLQSLTEKQLQGLKKYREKFRLTKKEE